MKVARMYEVVEGGGRSGRVVIGVVLLVSGMGIAVLEV